MRWPATAPVDQIKGAAHDVLSGFPVQTIQPDATFPWPPPAKVPHRCPICEGHGIVPGGFYERTPDAQAWTATNATEACRACGGQGIIYA